jgi:hypothetical protein
MVEVSRMGTSINKHTPLKGVSTADIYSINGIMANEFCETVYLALTAFAEIAITN